MIIIMVFQPANVRRKIGTDNERLDFFYWSGLAGTKKQGSGGCKIVHINLLEITSSF